MPSRSRGRRSRRGVDRVDATPPSHGPDAPMGATNPDDSAVPSALALHAPTLPHGATTVSTESSWTQVVAGSRNSAPTTPVDSAVDLVRGGNPPALAALTIAATPPQRRSSVPPTQPVSSPVDLVRGGNPPALAALTIAAQHVASDGMVAVFAACLHKWSLLFDPSSLLLVILLPHTKRLSRNL